MRIVYLVHHNVCLDDGVVKKLRSQVQEWQAHGHSVSVIARVAQSGPTTFPCQQFLKTNLAKDTFGIDSQLLDRVHFCKPDVVYFRYISWNRTLSEILKRFKCIGEINSCAVKEFGALWREKRTLLTWTRYCAYKYLGDLVLHRMVGGVAVTNEICREINARCPQKLVTIVPNSLRINEYAPLKKNVDYGEREPNIFFIGTPNQPWQGVDIALNLARKMPELHFHIVGEKRENLKNVTFYGYLKTSEYLPILAKCQVALGTLGLHRKNMREACPLKVREYLAHGFPCIIGYQDTAFPDGAPFLHRLDSSANITDKEVQQIRNFISKAKGMRVDYRDLAPIDAARLEPERLKFMESCIP